MIVRPTLVPDPDLDREDMADLQRRVESHARFEDDLDFAVSDVPGPIVAGVDQSFIDDRAISAIVAMRGGEVIERVHAETPPAIPYVPGYLSFREGPPILEAVERLSVEPDLYCFDGSGRIHYRQAGIATHVGVVLDVPAIGVAKRLLCGRPRRPVENLPAGARVGIEATPDVDAVDGTVLGYAVQTRQFDSPNRHVNPLYVSPGHRIGAATAADIVLRLTRGYKLPEPVRLADAHAEAVKGNR